MIRTTLLVTAMLAASHSAIAGDLAPAMPSIAAPAASVPASDTTTAAVIAQNATVSVSPIRATEPAAVDPDEKSAAPFRPRTTVKARIDDGRYSGFHQGGGDQPAGDQQFRPAERIQAENKRLSRESGERAPAPPQAGSTPAMRDQSTIVRTQ